MTNAPGPRVVSLVPSVTESLLTWGVVPVGCTRFCEQPDLVHVGGTKDPDVAAIIALGPDLVVFCEEENQLADYEALVDAGVRCHALRIDRVDDVAPQLAGLAAALGLDAPAGTDGGLDPPAALPVSAGAAGAAGPAGAAGLAGPGVRRRHRAFVPVWRRPWITLSGGTYGSSLLGTIGIDTLFARDERRYPEVTLDEVVAAQPDVVLLPTEPYPFKERHCHELAGIAPTVLVDGQDLFWWGVRTPAAQGRLARALALALGDR